MIIKLDKDFKDLKIGLLGFRSECFIPPLKKHEFDIHLVSLEEIDNSYDFIVESGVYNIIPEKYLNLPRYGFIGIHESPLPEGKGHAPLQWAVLNNRSNLTISLYKLDPKVDNGHIIYQYNMPISKTDVYADLESKRQQGITLCFDEFLNELKEGVLVLRKQTGIGSYHHKRTPLNSELDINKPLKELWDNIRICDNENYPAYFYINDKKIILNYSIE